MCGTIRNLMIFSFFVTKSFTDNFIDHSILQSCNEGEIVLNACNDCLCTDGVFHCTQKKCFQNKYVKDIGHKSKCMPNVAYQRNATVCVCKENGRWPYKRCDKMLQSLTKSVQRCEPSSFILVECNICRCNEDGIIDKNLCTKNKCQNTNINNSLRRTFDKKICRKGLWYSMGPCQLCYCSNEETLVCRVTKKRLATKSLGGYNFSVCGKNLINDAVGLSPKTFRVLEENNQDAFTTNDPEAKKNYKTYHDDDIIILNNKPNYDEKIHSDKNALPQNIIENSASETKEVDDRKFYNKEAGLINESYSKEKIEQEPVNGNDNNYSFEMLLKIEDDVNNNMMSTGFPPNDDFSSNEFTENKQIAKISKAISVADPEKLTSSVPIESFRQEKYMSNLIGGSSFSNNNESVRLNIPYVLNKILNLGLRKVNLVSDSKCVPGTVKTVLCNKCFCLNNLKMVCTDKVCN